MDPIDRTNIFTISQKQLSKEYRNSRLRSFLEANMIESLSTTT